MFEGWNRSWITHTHTHIYIYVCVCVCVCVHIYSYIKSMDFEAIFLVRIFPTLNVSVVIPSSRHKLLNETNKKKKCENISFPLIGFGFKFVWCNKLFKILKRYIYQSINLWYDFVHIYLLWTFLNISIRIYQYKISFHLCQLNSTICLSIFLIVYKWFRPNWFK